jgi:hypothetical protein
MSHVLPADSNLRTADVARPTIPIAAARIVHGLPVATTQRAALIVSRRSLPQRQKISKSHILVSFPPTASPPAAHENDRSFRMLPASTASFFPIAHRFNAFSSASSLSCQTTKMYPHPNFEVLTIVFRREAKHGVCGFLKSSVVPKNQTQIHLIIMSKGHGRSVRQEVSAPDGSFRKHSCLIRIAENDQNLQEHR